MTHVNNSTKTAVSAVWKPPSGYSGDVYFRYIDSLYSIEMMAIFID